MSGNSIGWGILGAGGIARTFAKELPFTRTGRLQAVAARDAARAEQLAREFDVPSAYGSYEELLADDRVDAVYIATVHTNHHEWVVRSAEAGKHVLCEKPLAISEAWTREATDAARRHGVFLAEAFAYRFFPQTARLVELVTSGAIGRVRAIDARYVFSATFDPGNRLFDASVAGGGILDVGCYPASITRLIAGAALGRPFADPLTVAGAGHIGETGVDEFAVAQLTFEDGITATLSAGIRVEGDRRVRIVGTRGEIEVPSPFSVRQGESSEILVSVLGEPLRRVRVEQPLQYGLEADAVGDRGDALEAPQMTWADSLGNARLLDAWRAQLGLVYPIERGP
jgi:predicted dehydrogenase